MEFDFDNADFSPVEPEKDTDGFDFAAAEFEPAEESMLEEAGSRIKSGASSFAQGVGEMFTAIPKGVAVAGAGSSKKILEQFGKIDEGDSKSRHMISEDYGPTEQSYVADYANADPMERAKLRAHFTLNLDPRESGFYKAGEAGSEFLKEALPTDERYKEDFLTTKVPGALGSAVGFMAQGALLRKPLTKTGLPSMAAGGVGAATGGAIVQSVSGFEDALDKGGTLEQAFESSELNKYLGLTEAIPISQFLNRLDKGTGGTVRKAIKDMLVEGTEEALQETFQTVSSNLIASDLVEYDEERGAFSGAQEGAEVGFTAGALMSLLTSMVVGRRGRGSAPAEQVTEPVKTEEEKTIEHVDKINSAETVEDAIQAANEAVADTGPSEAETLLAQITEIAQTEVQDGAIDEVVSGAVDTGTVQAASDIEGRDDTAGVLPAGTRVAGELGKDSVDAAAIGESRREDKPLPAEGAKPATVKVDTDDKGFHTNATGRVRTFKTEKTAELISNKMDGYKVVPRGDKFAIQSVESIESDLTKKVTAEKPWYEGKRVISVSLDAFTRKQGGISDSNFVDSFSTDKIIKAGNDVLGPLVNAKGQSADAMAQLAHEAGYIKESTPQALYDALDMEVIQGVEQYTPEGSKLQPEIKAKEQVSTEAIKPTEKESKPLDLKDEQSLFGAKERAEAKEKQPSLLEKPKEEPVAKGQSFEEIKNSAYTVASKLFGDDKYSEAVQNDWQKLLDAIDSGSVEKLNELSSKYQKDEALDGMGTGTAGAGPGKVRQGRRGAAQLARFAREAANSLVKKEPVATKPEVKEPVKKEAAEPKAEVKEAVKPKDEPKPTAKEPSNIITIDDIPADLKITLFDEASGKSKKVSAVRAMSLANKRVANLEKLRECLG